MKTWIVRAAVLAALVLTGVAIAQDSGPRITGPTKYEPHALVRLKAEGIDPKAGTMWRVSPSKGVQRATTPKHLLEFSAHPGEYEVLLLIFSQTAEGGLDIAERSVTVTIAGCSPVPPSPGPGPNPPTPPTPPGGGKLDPVNALAQVKHDLGGGRAGYCTCTVIHPQRADGRWDILCAAHCMPGQGSRGEVKMKDGRSFSATTRAHDRGCDLAWLVTDQPIADLPYAILSRENPPVGEAVWHMGYGVDKPGNREDGMVRAGENSDGQLQFVLSVSSGDSGGGIFNSKNEVVSAVCCTSIRGARTDMWGGSCRRAWMLRPKSGATLETPAREWLPVEIPQCRDGVRAADTWTPVEIPTREISYYRPQDGVSLKGR